MCTFRNVVPYYGDHTLVSTVHHPVSFPDPTLTFTNVTKALESVRNVGVLGMVLNVPPSVRDKISRDYATPEQQWNATVSHWLQSTPNASWSVLGGRLYLGEETAALKAVKQYIQSPTGMLQ